MKNLTFTLIRFLFVAGITYGIPNKAVAQQVKEVAKYENQKELTSNTSITFTDGFSVPAGAAFRAYITPGTITQINTVLNDELNSIVSYTVRVPGIIDPQDPKNDIRQVNVEIQTLDNFGRLVETQSVKATPNLKDVVLISKYDGLSRDYKKFLPYVKNTGTRNFSDKGYSAVAYDYYTRVGRTPSIAANASPLSETKYDNSPLSRVLETSSPGNDFSMNSGRTVRTQLKNAGGDVSRFIMDGGAPFRDPIQLNYYSLDLIAQSLEDENSSNGNGAVYEYKDKAGQVILKRQYNGTQAFSTYYVYDEAGNLRYVLPPKSQPDSLITVSQNILDNLCYQYRYDEEQRLTAKKIPGKGWEYMVYNKLNQVVMTQDAVQRSKAPQQWNIIKYDALGRNVITGIFTDLGSTANVDKLSVIQANVNAQSKQWETRVTTGNGYTADTYPTTWSTTLSINYYDDYNFPGGNPYPYTGEEISNMTRGLLTGTKMNVLGTANLLWTVNYYDSDGRALKTFKQHYKGGTLVANNFDEITNTYDFTGAVLSSNRSHKVNGTEQLKSLTEYSYDHRGRKINTWQTINAGARILLSQMVYDDLGQLYQKKLHSTNDGTTFLQTITYNYNERGWLSNANAPKLDVKLRYQNPTKGATAQYNGNISELEYTGEKSGNRWFTYTYDKLNRLTSSIYSTAAHELDERIAYDKAGNITSLKRGAATSASTIYNYANSGLSNQLLSVNGPIAGSFTYDVNGNAISDGTRGITAITYNQLNLPLTVTGSQTASYLYDGSGAKLKSVQATVTREYISGIHYKNNVLDFIGTEEGRAVRNTDGTYRYEYNLNDHLGNVRVSIADSAGVARVIQEDEYYAFGLNSNKKVSGDKNNYLYNGKEEQDVLTDEYDYGARFYDPQIGRWHVVDPSSEQGGQESLTQYQYGMNNPIRYTDPDGRCPTCPVLWAYNLYQAAKYKVQSVFGFKTYADGMMDKAANQVHSQDPDYVKNVPERTRQVIDKGGDIQANTKILQGATEIMDNASTAMGLAMGGVQGTMSASVEKVAAEKISVYRVYGGDAKADGLSWTPTDPTTVKNFRNAAGLPSGGASGSTNTAEFMVEGIVKPKNIIKSHPATPLDGNVGGLPEFKIKPKNVTQKTYSIFNPFK